MRSSTKMFRTLVLGVVTVLGVQAWGEEAPPPTPNQMLRQLGGSEELIRSQFGGKELQQAAAVQKRYFPKKYRHEIALQMGTLVAGEPYLSVQEIGGTYRFYFTEWLGVSGTYLTKFRQLNQAYDSVVNTVSASPEVIPPVQSYGLDVVLVPAYAKVNLLDLSIIRLELFLEMGPHRYHTDRAAGWAFHAASGVRVLPTSSFSFSLGVNNYLFQEQRLSGDKWRDVLSMAANISLWLPTEVN